VRAYIFIVYPIVFFICLINCSGCVSLLGKKQIKIGDAQEQINDLSTELGVIKDNQNSLMAQLTAKLNAVVAGINNQNETNQTAGRDSVSSTNDTSLMVVIIIVLGVLLLISLIGNLVIIIIIIRKNKKQTMLEKERQHYKTLFKGRDYKDESNNKS